MAFFEKYLYLKKSKLPGAGKGLFTRVDIPKGTRIVEYKGRLQPWKDVKHEDGRNAYLFKINSRVAINAEQYLKTFGRYANDARGFIRAEGLRNNADYEVEGNRCFMDATRKIKKGEEIFVAYGGNFWSLMRKIRKETEKQTKQFSTFNK